MRTIDPEHNWFWREGHSDGFAGERAIVPDEACSELQRLDYFVGHTDGRRDLANREIKATIQSQLERWQQIKFQEGHAAFEAGLPITANPDPPNSESGIIWDFGWAEAGEGR